MSTDINAHTVNWDVIDRARNDTSCKHLAAEYEIVENRGKGDWSARCPAHHDTDPSCSINDETFYCFACEATGGALHLFKHLEGMRADLDTKDGRAKVGAALANHQGLDPFQETGDESSAGTNNPPVRETDTPEASSGGAEANSGGEESSPDERDWAAIRAEHALSEGLDTLHEVWRSLDLDATGRQWLADERGIDPDVAEMFGVRSIERSAWLELLDTFDERALRRAGLCSYYLRPDWDTPPDRETIDHAVVFPYINGATGYVDTLRVRETHPNANVESVCSLDHPFDDPPDEHLPHRPSDPYLGWAAIEKARHSPHPLYVVEGELDALSIAQADRPAVGSTSASTWRPAWCEAWNGLDVVILADGGDGGETFAMTVQEAARKALGTDFVARHLHARQAQLNGDEADANDWLRAGELQQYLDTQIEEEIHYV